MSRCNCRREEFLPTDYFMSGFLKCREGRYIRVDLVRGFTMGSPQGAYTAVAIDDRDNHWQIKSFSEEQDCKEFIDELVENWDGD